MANDFLTPPRLRPRFIAIAVVTLVGVVGVVAMTARRTESSTTVAQPVRRSEVAPSPTGTLPSAVPTEDVATAASVVLVRGERLVNGVAMGYPHSQVGAVSAAVEYLSQACSTLDPDRAAAVGRLIGDGSPGATPDDFAQGRVNMRQYLGLPVSGPLPETAMAVLGPVAFQLRDASADRVVVLLLGYLTTSSPKVGMRTGLGVFPVLMVWRDADWKLGHLTGAGDFSSLGAQPGSLRAAELGWREMTR